MYPALPSKITVGLYCWPDPDVEQQRIFHNEESMNLHEMQEDATYSIPSFVIPANWEIFSTAVCDQGLFINNIQFRRFFLFISRQK